MPLQPLQPNVQRQLAVEAQRMYELNCTICHAPDGKGIRQSVPSLVQSFTEADRQRLINAVLFGSDSGGMPSFGYVLSPRDAAQVLNHSIIKLAEAPIAPFGANEIACSLGSPPPIQK
jgi:mono/diheme cytochrome c family protein